MGFYLLRKIDMYKKVVRLQVYEKWSYRLMLQFPKIWKHFEKSVRRDI